MKTIKVRRSLAEKYPDIARQWHPTKNKPLTPHDVTPRSGKKAWWVCDKGHDDWLARIADRTGKKPSGCPECGKETGREGIRKAAIRRSGSLAEKYPDIARQWHPTKNKPLTPHDVTPRSGKKAWWVCDKGHEWPTRIFIRTGKKPSGCPECGKEKVIKAALRRSGSLAEKYPDIARQWHPTKNLPLTPHDVTPGSNRKAWWVCDKGHEWKVKVANRTGQHSGCPECYAEKRKRTTG
jgi:predicted RNA-binding Zn-ribbon protein involved in translation (DUF1610 family)